MSVAPSYYYRQLVREYLSLKQIEAYRNEVSIFDRKQRKLLNKSVRRQRNKVDKLIEYILKADLSFPKREELLRRWKEV